MKLAFSTLGCPGWSWNEIFATAKDMGLGGIEIRGIENELFAPHIKCFNPQHIEATKQQVSTANMQIPMLTSGASLGTGDTKAAMQEARAYIELAARLGASFVRVMITPRAEVDPADIPGAKALYTQLCDYAKGTGVIPLIETNGVLASSKEMAAFLQDLDPATCGALWDIHHPYRFFAETPEQTYQNIGKYIKYVHVKDSAMKDGALVYRMMGYGDVPVLDSLRILKAHGYQGFVSLEWLKRWCPDLQEPGIVFAHFANYMTYLLQQL